MAKYIAMWSGPRNISTAMMRGWGSRPDTFVCDEPLYAHYLVATGHTDHPGYAETIRRHETDWRKVVEWLTGPVPDGKAIFYQKHMAHHLLADMHLEWVSKLTNCLLIRDPADVLRSLAEFLPSPTAEDTGLPNQVSLFHYIRGYIGTNPLVIDASDVLLNPRGMMAAMCRRLQVPFSEAMLNWPAGPRETDGAWAPYWYAKVDATTTFGPYRPQATPLPEHLRPVLDECHELYGRLYQHRIAAETPIPESRPSAQALSS